jgi:hypothetical protein
LLTRADTRTEHPVLDESVRGRQPAASSRSHSKAAAGWVSGSLAAN